MATLPPELTGMIFMACQLPMLFVLAATSRAMRTLAASELRQRHHDHLKGFFPHPPRFLAALRQFNAIVAGSVALAYFEGVTESWSPNECNIYLPCDKYEDFLNYVQFHEGYVIDASDEARAKVAGMVTGLQWAPGGVTRTTGIGAVTSLVRAGNRRIQVIKSQSFFAAYPLPRSSSTLAMCFISGTGFCCPYPGPTSEGVGLQNMNQVDFRCDWCPTIGSSHQECWLNGVHVYKVTSPNTCYRWDPVMIRNHNHAWDQAQRVYSYQRWTEGPLWINYTGDHTHSTCPLQSRFLFDKHSFTFTFNDWDQERNPMPEDYDPCKDPIFDINAPCPTPNARWRMQWRLGGARQSEDDGPGPDIVAGWTKTTLEDDAGSKVLCKRLSLHIPEHRQEFVDEVHQHLGSLSLERMEHRGNPEFRALDIPRDPNRLVYPCPTIEEDRELIPDLWEDSSEEGSSEEDED